MAWYNDVVSATTGELSALLGSNDPALKTCDPAEAAIRNKLAFTDLYISFPTTQKISGRIGMDTERLRLPAYIAEFKDAYSPNFGETQVFGRADPIPVYSNTKRQVSIGVMIPCYDVADSNENMKKVNQLIKNLYPGYEKLKSGSNVLSSPPLIRIKFANLIMNHKNPAQGLLGYVTSFSTDFNLKGGVFLAAPGGAGTAGQEGMVLPRAIGINITFTALHESTIGFRTNSGVNQFFGNENYPYNTKTLADERTGALSKTAGMGSYSELNRAAAWEIMGTEW